MPEPTNPPITVDAVAEALYAADPPLPDTDEVAHYYECLGEAEAAMPVVRAVWPLAVAEGRRQAAADPCPCQTLRDQPHPSRDNLPDCSWCGRPRMAAVHDPRHGRVLGAQIKAEGVENA